MPGEKRSALVIGIVYFVLYMGSAWASRKAVSVKSYAGGEEQGTLFVWKITSFIYILLIPLLYYQFYTPVLILFVALYILQNLWRPLHISRFEKQASENQGATILSVESQSKSVAVMILAPILGFLVDKSQHNQWGGEFWAAAVVCALVASFITLVRMHREKGVVEMISEG